MKNLGFGSMRLIFLITARVASISVSHLGTRSKIEITDAIENQLRHGHVRRARDTSSSCPAIGETGLAVGRLHEAEWTLPLLLFL